ncbi:hypothetical protein ACFLYW_02545, partial [Thermodesulfobacteriota bacterium]
MEKEGEMQGPLSSAKTSATICHIFHTPVWHYIFDSNFKELNAAEHKAFFLKDRHINSINTGEMKMKKTLTLILLIYFFGVYQAIAGSIYTYQPSSVKHS